MTERLTKTLSILAKLVAGGMAIGVCQSALAATDVVNCDDCSSYEQSIAAGAESQSGRVYVADRVNDTIAAYDVTTYTEFNPPQSIATQTSTSTKVQNFFNELIVQYHTSQSPGVEVPIAIAESAHDLVGDSQLQAEVGAWLLGTFFAQPTTGGEPDEELEEIRDEIIGGEPIKTVFSDDSTARFVAVDFAVGDMEFDLVDNSLSDAQNNDIPDSPGDVQPGDTGSFSSGGPGGLTTRDAFVGTLQRLGIPYSGGGTSGGGSCATFTCSSTPEGVECIFTIGGC